MPLPHAFRSGSIIALLGTCILAGLAGLVKMEAHSVTDDPTHDKLERLIAQALAAERTGPARVVQLRPEKRPSDGSGETAPPGAALIFSAFSPAVRLRWDEHFLYVESTGLPAHGMMVGITAWQQQVPLPQSYTGRNAWRIPLQPVVSAHPVSIKGRFLRGAIALAANGIPIFNPQNNRGEISQEIGELDEWGGHCGRADDYHYHAAPLHLQNVVGAGQPIAYALDGYPIFGLTEPDGSAPANLDAFNGHETAGLGYHYHGSTKYPYVNGGFHGEVVEREGQVDPQPRAQPIRPALPPLRGARITGFATAPDQKSFSLRYVVNGKTAAVNYTSTGEGTWKFQFIGPDGVTREETYRAGRGGGGDRRGGRPGPNRDSEPPAERERRPPGASGDGATGPQTYVAKRSGKMTLRSPVVGADGALPPEFTGDGQGVSPPLDWAGVPLGTKSIAVIMHHLDPEGKAKWYWTLYNIPASVSGLPKDVQGVGTPGNNSVTRRAGYAPPHSKGPGEKTYILTAYALSAPLQISAPASEVNRELLLAAMKDIILDSAELKVVYTRPNGDAADEPRGEPPRGRAKGSGRS